VNLVYCEEFIWFVSMIAGHLKEFQTTLVYPVWVLVHFTIL